MTEPVMPLSQNDITAEWLRRSFRSVGADASGIDTIMVRPLGGEGNAFNGLGSLFRCQLISEGATPARPQTVIVKLPGADRMANRFAKWLLLYKREIDFYRRVAPSSPVQSPRVLYSNIDRKGRKFVLVMEDLGHMASGIQADGIKPEQAMLAVREIAMLHGRFWNATDRPPVAGTYDTLGAGYGRLLQSMYMAGLELTLDRLGDLFLPETRRLAEDLGTRITSHFAGLATGPRTFVHGDVRAENMFFGTGSGDDFAMIDWQASGVGAGLYDLACLLATNVSTDGRRGMEHEALEEYHGIVCRMGAKDFTVEDCWRGYRQNMLGAFMAMMLGCGAFIDKERRLVEIARKILSRTVTAVEDLEAFEFLPERDKPLGLGSIVSTLSTGGRRMVGTIRKLRSKKSHR